MTQIFRTLVLSLTIIYSAVYPQTPYELSAGKESILVTSGLALSVIGFSLDSKVAPLSRNEYETLNRSSINWFDRPASYNYSPSAADVSDILLSTATAAPLLLFLSGEVRKDAAQYSLMLAEMMMFSYSITHIVKGTAQRFRPYAYNESAPENKKADPDTRKSFFSGHASFSFASMVFLSETYASYHPDSKYKSVIRAGALLVAGATSYFRFEAGKHFPTDIITGALVGSAIGYIIPELHKRTTETVVNYSPYQVSITIPF